MSRIFDVLKYNEDENYHVCREHRKSFNERLDLMVNGDFEEGYDPNNLVGKTITFEYSHPYISIAVGVEIVKQPQP